MPHIEPIEIIQRLIVLVLAAVITSWCWLIWNLWTGQPTLPDEPLVARRPVPWRFGTILLVLVLYGFVTTLISLGYSVVAGLLPGKLEKVPWSHLMFLNGMINVILLCLIPPVVRMSSGARPGDFGLSFFDWWRQVVYGVIATFITAPAVYAIQFGAAKIWTPIEHPLSKMIAEEFSVGVGWLAVVTAVILAPLFEELVFRGLLQSWLVTLLDQGSGRLSASWRDGMFRDTPTEKMSSADERDGEHQSVHPPPVSLEDNALTVKPPDRRWLGIVLTSILFAYVHAAQWPAPIALFVLALVIGSVYERTGSLITAICMHATFNGISTLVLFATVLLGAKSEPEKAIEKLPVERRGAVKVGEMDHRTVTVVNRIYKK